MRTFIFLVILCFVDAPHAERPIMELIAGVVTFVENEDADFFCLYRGDNDNITLSWHFRERKYKQLRVFKPFYKESFGVRSLNFTLRMLRIFADEVIICTSDDGGRAELQIGDVKRTIPVNISLQTREYLDVTSFEGYKLEYFIHYCCNVSADPSLNGSLSVFLMDLLFDKKFPLVRRDETQFCDDDWHSPPLPKVKHTGWPLACLAKSAAGKVYSENGTILVYDPEFKNSPVPISLILEAAISVSVTYIDLQLPLYPKRIFTVCEIGQKGKCFRNVTVHNVTIECLRRVPFEVKVEGLKSRRHLEKVTIRANVTFSPGRPGKYGINFVIGSVARHVPEVLVKSHYAEIFDENVLTEKVTLGAFGEFSFHLNTSMELRKEQLSVMGPFGAALSPEDLRVKIDRRTSLARINFVVVGTGNYRVVFRDPRANASGSAHWIQAEKPEIEYSSINQPLSDAVSASIEYSALQPLAFPERVIRVYGVNDKDDILIKIDKIRTERLNKKKFNATITFDPGQFRHLRVFFEIEKKRLPGPAIRITDRDSSSSLVTENPQETETSKNPQASPKPPNSPAKVATGIVVPVLFIIVIGVVIVIVIVMRRRIRQDVRQYLELQVFPGSAAREGHRDDQEAQPLLRYELSSHQNSDDARRLDKALLQAAAEGNTAEVRESLRAGANVVCKDNDGRTPLHLAAENGKDEVVRVLLEKEAEINCKDNDGRTPLHDAAEKGKDDVVRVLLETDAEMNCKDNDGRMPLHLATKNGHGDVVRSLLEKRAKIDCKDDDGRTPLHNAAANGSDAVVRDLLENEAEVNCKDDDGRTPLHRAAENGNGAVVRVLLEKEAKIDCKDNKGRTPLHMAAGNGKNDMVRVLLEKEAKINSKDNYGRTPLHMASEKGEYEVVCVLLKKEEVEVNCKDKNRCTPLHRAAECGKNELVRVLLEKQAEINCRDKDRCTPLHRAAENGNDEVVRILLKENAEIDCKDDDGCTPLHKAAENGKNNVVRILLQKGAKINCKDRYGRTPLHKAAKNGNNNVVRVLWAKEAEINCKDKDGWTALHRAAEEGKDDVVRFLLEKQAKINCTDDVGFTPLHRAAENGYDKVVRVLLEKAEINCKDKYGCTPLHRAAENGKDAVVRILLKKEAEVNCKDDDGRTPLHRAAENGNDGVVRILLENKAKINCQDNSGRTPFSYAKLKNKETTLRLLEEAGARA